MAAVKLTKRVVEAAKPGAKDIILWDNELKGFGCKITPKGKRVYFAYYRTRGGQQRRPTIGAHGPVTCEQAREIARQWLGEAAHGGDPSAHRKAKRDTPTMAAFAERYLAEHARPKKKPLSVEADERNLRNHVLPALGRLKVDAVTRADAQRFHHSMKATPGAANRCLALVSKMFNLAEKWGLRPDGSNPCRHVEKYPERKIERFLSADELARLGQVLSSAERSGVHSYVVGAIRLLIFTGCRRDEILKLRWEHVDMERQCLRLPDSKTGAKVIYLSPPALEVLAGLERQEGNPYVLPGQVPGQHYVALEKAWHGLRFRAGLSDIRLHDLRHSFASFGAAAGLSLPIIGALLGHREAATTQRYAHLSADPLRQATDRIGARIASAMNGSGEKGGLMELPRHKR
jgi:integrase